MRQQENQWLEQERDFALRCAQFLAAALRADVCRAGIDVPAGAKPDVVGLAAVVAVRGSAGRDPSAAETKPHKLLSKNGSLWSPAGLSHTGDQKPSRLRCSRVESQKIFWVCSAMVLRSD